MRLILATCLCAALSSCGVWYNSPQVTEGETETGITVDVVQVTYQTAVEANAANSYQPRRLPSVLTQNVSAAPRKAPPVANIAPAVRKEVVTTWPEPLRPEPYRLGVGDVLLFSPPAGTAIVPTTTTGSLEQASARRQEYTIQDDGSIVIPEVGRIRVAGLTLEATEQEVFDALLENQKEPTFSLEISSFNSQRVDVSGLVKAPQVLPITLNPLYLREAIARAGGTTVEDTDNVIVKLFRDGAEYQMLLSEVFSESTLGRQLLADGDAVFVDKVFSKEQADAYFQQQLSLYEAENRARQQELENARTAATARLELGAIPRDHVYLIGEVRKQQRVELPFERRASLADMLFNDQGFSLETGDVSQIYVLRRNASDGVTAYHLDGSNIANIAVATAFEMQADDFVFIAEQPITRWNRVISQSVPSLVTTVTSSVVAN